MYKPQHGTLYYVVDGEIFDHKGPVKGGKYDPTTQSVSLDDADDADVPPAAKEHYKGGVRANNYCRMFDAERDDNVLSQEMLIELGDAMMHGDRGTGDDEGSAGIPAAYTYFGQFIAHEMTRVGNFTAAQISNLVTPTLDLGSIFGEAPEDSGISITAAGRPQLPLGETSEFSAGVRLRQDLPRDHPKSGAPLIPDKRNDENTPLAQTHVAIMKFFNSVARECPDSDPATVRKIVVQHFQSVVLHDYLRHLVDPIVYNDVIENRRAVFLVDSGDRHRQAESGFRLPIEFAMAFRFGHSMIRDKYERWTGTLEGNLPAFWFNTYRSNRWPGTFQFLKFEWVNNWLRILPFQDTKYRDEQAEFTRRYLPNDEENPITAAPIDTRLAVELGNLPEQVGPRDSAGMKNLPANLAARTLLRHRVLRLRDGRSMAHELCERLRGRGRPALHVLSDDEVRDGEPCFARLSAPTAMAVARRPPLWFYVLREAKVLGHDGRHLGPLGSRIIMESIHAAIEHSSDSILREDGWTPDRRLRPSHSKRYTLPDLIAFAGHPWPSLEAEHSSTNMPG